MPWTPHSCFASTLRIWLIPGSIWWSNVFVKTNRVFRFIVQHFQILKIPHRKLIMNSQTFLLFLTRYQRTPLLNHKRILRHFSYSHVMKTCWLYPDAAHTCVKPSNSRQKQRTRVKSITSSTAYNQPFIIWKWEHSNPSMLMYPNSNTRRWIHVNCWMCIISLWKWSLQRSSDKAWLWHNEENPFSPMEMFLNNNFGRQTSS